MRVGGVVAVIPMKPLHAAKSRLAERLSPSQRSALALGMFRRVVEAALASDARGVWIFGGDEIVEQLSLGMGAEWHDDCGSDLNSTLTSAFQKAYAAGFAPLYLPADLPFLEPAEIDNLVLASEDCQKLVLSRAHRDGGTNAFLVPVGSPFRPNLGYESFQRHIEQAVSLGLPFAIYDSPGLGRDLDTPADLDAYENVEPGFVDRLMNIRACPSA